MQDKTSRTMGLDCFEQTGFGQIMTKVFLKIIIPNDGKILKTRINGLGFQLGRSQAMNRRNQQTLAG